MFIASYSRAEMSTLLRAAHTPVYRFSNFDRIDDIANNVRQLGYLIGEDAAAARVVADMNERLARARARAAASGRHPRIMSYDGSGYTAGANTLFDDVIEQAGGVNVSAEHGAKGFGRVSGEQILEWQPEYLICGAKPGDEDIVRRRLMDNPAIATSTAVKSGRLILMDTRVFLTTSHHVVTAVEALVDALYGDGSHPALARPKSPARRSRKPVGAGAGAMTLMSRRSTSARLVARPRHPDAAPVRRRSFSASPSAPPRSRQARCMRVLAAGVLPIRLDRRASADDPQSVVIWSIRTPRVIVAMLVGAALAVAGTQVQGLFQNPMASPDVIATSSGGAVGAVLAIVLGFAQRRSSGCR